MISILHELDLKALPDTNHLDYGDGVTSIYYKRTKDAFSNVSTIHRILTDVLDNVRDRLKKG